MPFRALLSLHATLSDKRRSSQCAQTLAPIQPPKRHRGERGCSAGIAVVLFFRSPLLCPKPPAFHAGLYSRRILKTPKAPRGFPALPKGETGCARVSLAANLGSVSLRAASEAPSCMWSHLSHPNTEARFRTKGFSSSLPPNKVPLHGLCKPDARGEPPTSPAGAIASSARVERVISIRIDAHPKLFLPVAP